jgi:hypothetical protein
MVRSAGCRKGDDNYITPLAVELSNRRIGSA